MMHQSSPRHWHDSARLRIALCAALAALMLLALLPAFAGIVQAERPNGAGLVVQFDDGSVLYAYVQFTEESISSEELLYRSGLDVVISPYGGLGGAVCNINGSGCPSDNCFCQSYTNPAYFWHFYSLGSGWQLLPFGPSSRDVSDGDVDGWSWNAGQHALPATDIDAIALLNGIDRNAVDPTPTATATATTPPPPTETPAPTQTATPPPTATVDAPATGTTEATSTATATIAATGPAVGATGTSQATASATATATSGTSGTGTRTVAVTPEAADGAASAETGTPGTSDTEAGTGTGNSAQPSPTLTLIARSTTVAVIVDPSGTVTPVEVTQAAGGRNLQPVLLFGGTLLGVVAVGGLVWYRRTQIADDTDTDV